MLAKTVSSNIPENAKTEGAFKPSSWLNKIDFINHLVMFNNVLICVNSEQGGGKTTFSQLLQSQLDSSIRSCTLQVVAPFSVDDLLRNLCEAFHLRKDTDLTISSMVEQINERKAHVLLIVDDAQHLPDQLVLEIIQEIQKQGINSFFHICLLSDYSMSVTLSQFDQTLVSSSVHQMELGALTENETKTYLLRYLPSPKRLDITMTDKRLGQFYDLTAGKVAQINKKMIEFFDAETIASLSKNSSGTRKKTLLALGASLCLIAGTYIVETQTRLFDDFNLPFFKTVESNYPSIPVATIQAQLVAAREGVFVAEPINTAQANIGNYSISYIAEWSQSSVNQMVQTAPIRSASIFDMEDEVENELGENVTDLVEMDKVLVIPKPGVKIAHEVDKRETVKAEVVKLKSRPVAVKQAPLKPAALVALNAKQFPLGTQKTLASAASSANAHYTIQLLSGRNQNDLKKFINKHPDIKHAVIRKTNLQGSEWYVLTYGVFSQKDEANKALLKLPNLKGWIRPLTSLESVG